MRWTTLILGHGGLRRALKGKTLRVVLGGSGEVDNGDGDNGDGDNGDGDGVSPFGGGVKEEGDNAGLLSGVNVVLNHLALLKRLGLPRHCVHVDFGGGGGVSGRENEGSGGSGGSGGRGRGRGRGRGEKKVFAGHALNALAARYGRGLPFNPPIVKPSYLDCFISHHQSLTVQTTVYGPQISLT